MANVHDLESAHYNLLIAYLEYVISNKVAKVHENNVYGNIEHFKVPSAFAKHWFKKLVDQNFLSQSLHGNELTWEIHPDFQDDAYQLCVELGLINNLNLDQHLLSAANNFVAIDHNSENFKEAVRSLSGLKEEVQKTNVELTADPADKLPISCEINNLKLLIEQPKVRVAAIFIAIQENSVLRWLEVQAASATIKTLASQAIKFLEAFLPHK